MDADLQRRRRRRARHRPTCGCASAGGARPGHGARRARGSSAMTPARRRRVAHRSPTSVGGRYQRPFDVLPLDDDAAERVVAADFVSTDDGSGIVHLAPAFGEDDAAGRPAPRACRCSTRSTPTAPSTTASRPCTGMLREGRRPRDHRRPRGARACSCARSRTSTATRTAGAATRRSSTGPRRRGSPARRSDATELLARERAHRLAPRAPQARPLRQVAREQRRLGAVARPLLGHAAARSGAAASGHDTCVGSVAELDAPRRPRPRRASTCTAPTSTTSTFRVHRRRLRAHGRRGCRPCSTRGSTRGRCRRRSTTTRSRASRRLRRRASRPTSSARRSTRPAAGSTRCSR